MDLKERILAFTTKSHGFPDKRPIDEHPVMHPLHTRIDTLPPDHPSIVNIRKMKSFDIPTQLQHPLRAVGSRYWVPMSLLDKLDPKWKSSHWFQALYLRPENAFARHKAKFRQTQSKGWPLYDTYIRPKGSKLTDDYLLLPRMLGISLFGMPTRSLLVKGTPIDVQFRFTITHRPEQIIALEQIKLALDKWSGAFVEAACGIGKTILAFLLMKHYNVKTVICVPNTVLKDQWKQCFQNYTPSLKVFDHVGAWKYPQEPPTEPSDTTTIWNADVVIITATSATMVNIPKAFDRTVGFVIVDEAHILAAETFSSILPQWSARYVLGLSATPMRKDRLEHALYWLLGPCIFRYQRIPSITLLKHTVNVHRIIIPQQPLGFLPDMEYVTALTVLLNDAVRNSIIVSLAKACIHTFKRQKIVIFTARIDHIKLLQSMLTTFFEPSEIATIKGAATPEQIAYSKDPSIKIVIGTYAYLHKGYDDTKLDTMIMAAPCGSTGAILQQSVGRIERSAPGKLLPIVFDLVDRKVSLFNRQSLARKHYYAYAGYMVHESTPSAIFAKHTLPGNKQPVPITASDHDSIITEDPTLASSSSSSSTTAPVTPSLLFHNKSLIANLSVTKHK